MQFRGKASHACSTPARTRSVPNRLASTILIYGRVAPRMANKVLLLERCGRISDLPIAGMLARTCFPAPPSKGTWCSGITPAQHAGGPGFNPQCVHHCHLAPAHPLHNTAPRQMQIAPAGSRTRVTSMGGLYDAVTLLVLQQSIAACGADGSMCRSASVATPSRVCGASNSILCTDAALRTRSSWAHGVVVSHPLRMRKALGSNPSGSNITTGVAAQARCNMRAPKYAAAFVHPRAHGVVVSHPLRMRKALGSNPSGSNLRARWRIAPACQECEYRAGGTAQMCPNHAGHLSHGCACDGPSAWACHLQRLTAGASLLGAPSWARGLVVGSRALWLGVCEISVVQSAGL